MPTTDPTLSLPSPADQTNAMWQRAASGAALEAADLRARLATFAVADPATTNVSNVDNLHSVVQQIAAAEAAAWAYGYAANILANPDLGPEDVLSWVLDTMAQGADDSWSGRSNDLRRATHDARLRTLRSIAATCRRMLDR